MEWTEWFRVLDTKDKILTVGIVAGLAGVGVTLLVGLANLFYSITNNRRTTFINTIANERIKWINKLRENISKLIAISLAGRDEKPAYELERLRYEIWLQLNPTKESHKKIEIAIFKLPGNGESNNADSYKELVLATQELLKSQWDRANDEAKYGDQRERKRRYNRWWQKMCKWLRD